MIRFTFNLIHTTKDFSLDFSLKFLSSLSLQETRAHQTVACDRLIAPRHPQLYHHNHHRSHYQCEIFSSESAAQSTAVALEQPVDGCCADVKRRVSLQAFQPWQDNQQVIDRAPQFPMMRKLPLDPLELNRRHLPQRSNASLLMKRAN